MDDHYFVEEQDNDDEIDFYDLLETITNKFDIITQRSKFK